MSTKLKIKILKRNPIIMLPPSNLSDIQLNVISCDHVYRELHRFWQKFLCSVIVLEHVSLKSSQQFSFFYSFLTFISSFCFAILSDMKFTPVTYLT